MQVMKPSHIASSSIRPVELEPQPDADIPRHYSGRFSPYLIRETRLLRGCEEERPWNGLHALPEQQYLFPSEESNPFPKLS